MRVIKKWVGLGLAVDVFEDGVPHTQGRSAIEGEIFWAGFP